MRNERQSGSRGSKGLSKGAQRLLLLIGGVVLLVAVVIGITVAVFNSKHPQQPEEDVSAPSESISSSELVEDTEYDPTENVLETDKYTGTILPATEDAGVEYLKDTLFIGDSNTYRYMQYTDDLSLKNVIGVVGMGIQDVLVKDTVKFVGYSDRVTIPEAVKIMHPQRIIICFGTNNAGGDWSPEYMAQQYGLMLDGIEEAWPYADIIISAIPPINRFHDAYQRLSMTTIDAYNKALVSLAEERGCKFLNTSEVLKDPETGFIIDGYTISDGIHLKQEGVDAILGYVRTHAYITEDRRPADLPKVPNRDEPEPYNINDELAYTGTVAGSGSSKKEGLSIVFAVNDAKMGALSGEVEQIVPAGEKCTEVVAKPKEGYSFAYWSCTVGRIDDVYSPKLSFVSPAGFDTDKVIVTANFVASGHLVQVKSSDAKVGTAGIRGDDNTLLSKVNVKEDGEVRLYASLNAEYSGKYKFVGWQIESGGTKTILSNSAEYTYKPTDSVEITALFEAISFATSVTTDGSAGCSVDYASSNGELTATAKAADNFVFDYWTVNGERYDTNNPTTIRITQDLTVVAHFKAKDSSSDASSSNTGSSDPGSSDSSSSDTGSSDPGSSTHTHSVTDATWQKDASGHWQNCSGCSEKQNSGAHDNAGATCTTAGVCSVCGQPGSVNAANHTGGTEVRGQVAPTESAAGYTGDTWCLGCNTQIAAGTPIDPLPPASSSVESPNGTGSTDGGNTDAPDGTNSADDTNSISENGAPADGESNAG